MHLCSKPHFLSSVAERQIGLHQDVLLSMQHVSEKLELHRSCHRIAACSRC